MRKLSIVGIALGLLGPTAAPGQDYPNRPIRMIVPGLPGGSADIIARMIGTKLHERFGQPVVVDNRSGAGQMIGAEALAKSPPDGHALLFATVTYTTSVATRSSLPFDPLNDVTGVTMVGRGPLLFVVHPSLPVKSIQDFIALAKKRPSSIDYASSGTGTIVHLVPESFASLAGIQIVHVPFKSIAPAVTAVVGGHVPAMFASLPASWHHVKANRLRALAVSTAQRSDFVPDLPTIAESGVREFEASTWWGLFTQGKTPKEAIAKLNAEVQSIIAADDIKARFAAEGARGVTGMTPEAFNALVRSDIAKWRKIAKERNISGSS